MLTISVDEAAHRLPELIRDVQAGEEVVIEAEHIPVAKIVGLPATKKVPVRGTARDAILFLADDFDAPLDDLREYM